MHRIGEAFASVARNRRGESGMFKKLFVLMVAASALGACETQSGAVMTPPMAKTGTPNPAQAPVSYMTFFDLGSTKLSEQSMATLSQAAPVYQTRTNVNV